MWERLPAAIKRLLRQGDFFSWLESHSHKKLIFSYDIDFSPLDGLFCICMLAAESLPIK